MTVTGITERVFHGQSIGPAVGGLYCGAQPLGRGENYIAGSGGSVVLGTSLWLSCPCRLG
jgi:hypothetical protein